ncbi:MAG: chemotaxis protein CheB [Parachlamydiales bacterium]|jgi:two-component system chemotaxis response regulator CheB
MKEKFKAIVCGGSAGGFESLENIIKTLPKDFSLPIIVVLHVGQEGGKYFASLIKRFTSLAVREPVEKEYVVPGVIYIAPPGYHLLVEEDYTFSYSSEEKVCFSRPSIDVLFSSAAEAYREQLIGILLSGANTDGSEGIADIMNRKGITIVEDPQTAKFQLMPSSAIKRTPSTLILNSSEMSVKITQLLKQGKD